MAARLEFKELSLDIKRLILGFIDRPTDLKNLCLTCKEIRDITTPILYRSIHLFVGGPQDLRLSSMLSGGNNPGVNHIREIYLRLEKLVQDKPRHSYHSDDSSDEDDQEENVTIPARQSQLTVRILLDFLPANILEVFSWQNWEPLSVDNFMLLCQKQKSLRVLEIGPMDRPLDPLLEKHPDIFEGLTELNSVDVYPDTVDRLKASQKLLKAKPHIEHLCVSTGFEYAHNHNDIPEDLHDSSTRPGLISRTLFSHMMPFETCESPMVLKNLDLDTIELRYAADTWLKIIKFSCLERLEIRNCAGADTVFAQLSKPHNRPQRLKSLRWMDDDKSEPHALEALEGFLEGYSGLETLHIFISRMRALPRVSSIVHHKKTLTSLSIHSQLTRESVHTYGLDDFSRLCTECSELRQLSVIFPKTSAEEPVLQEEFVNFLLNTMKLPKLVTLNIRRWPLSRGPFIGSTHKILPHLRQYEHELQRISQYIFETSDNDAKVKGYGLGNRSCLSVVSWGGNGKTRHDAQDSHKLKQISFVRGKKIDAFGQVSMLAVQIIWRLVQFIEPESDILNHSLYDMAEIHHGLGL